MLAFYPLSPGREGDAMNEKTMSRSVFFLSDGTGITAETFGRSLLSQFGNVEFHSLSWPFLDTPQKAQEAVDRIDQATREEGAPPLVFSTLVDPELRAIVHKSRAMVLDLFETCNTLLERELGTSARAVRGRSHGMGDYTVYNARITALNFALASDDGVTTANYPAAEIILLGVSRSGKTPTCLYLSLQYGILAANYPLTEDDFESNTLPKSLQPYREKLFGLTIDTERLHQIRSERLPNSRYANRAQCQYELSAIEALFKREKIPYINTTSMSIEEIATTIMQQAGLKRRLMG